MNKLKTYESFDPEVQWEEEGDVFEFDHPIYNRDEIPFSIGDHVKVKWYNKSIFHGINRTGKIKEIDKFGGKLWVIIINVGFLHNWVNGTTSKASIELIKGVNESFEPEEEWEEEENPIPKELESFLKDNNCYEEYVNNINTPDAEIIRKTWKHPSGLYEFYEKTDKILWISGCFEWIQYYDKWYEINNKWEDYLIGINESFEPEEEWENEPDEDYLNKYPWLNQEFVDFMTERDLMDEYIKEIEKSKSEVKSPLNYISGGIIWVRTDRGYEFWNRLSVEWMAYYKNIMKSNESFEPEEEWEEEIELDLDNIRLYPYGLVYKVYKENWNDFADYLYKNGWTIFGYGGDEGSILYKNPLFNRLGYVYVRLMPKFRNESGRGIVNFIRTKPKSKRFKIIKII